jgi:hypothetical protein
MRQEKLRAGLTTTWVAKAARDENGERARATADHMQSGHGGSLPSLPGYEAPASDGRRGRAVANAAHCDQNERRPAARWRDGASGTAVVS